MFEHVCEAARSQQHTQRGALGHLKINLEPFALSANFKQTICSLWSRWLPTKQRIVPKLKPLGRAVETHDDTESFSPSLLSVLFQNQSAHRSSIIQSVSLHCFSFCFHIHHLASAHLVELCLFLEPSFFSTYDGEVLLSLCGPLNVLHRPPYRRRMLLFCLLLHFT